MTNLERAQLEISFDFPQQTLETYLQENGLNPNAEYNPESNLNKKAIYQTVLQVLENVSQDIRLMKEYKNDDVSVMDFHENLMNKINQLERKIRMMSTNDDVNHNSSVFMLFNS